MLIVHEITSDLCYPGIDPSRLFLKCAISPGGKGVGVSNYGSLQSLTAGRRSRMHINLEAAWSLRSCQQESRRNAVIGVLVLCWFVFSHHKTHLGAVFSLECT